MVTIFIVSSEPSCLSEACRILLTEQNGFDIIGEATSLSQVMDGLSDLRPDILLLDCRLLYSGGLEEIADICQQQPETKVLLISDFYDNFDFVAATLYQGARGILASTTRPEDYCKAIHTVLAGDLWISRKLLASFLQKLLKGLSKQSTWTALHKNTTEREREIAQYVAQGMTNKEIAKHLGISDKTVKVHLSNIFHKLKINRRSKIFQIAS